MNNIKTFEKLLSGLPRKHDMLPEKIRKIVNERCEYTDYAKVLVLGAYLVLNDELSLTGYKDDGTNDPPCTEIVVNETGKII
jgi:preprotein translocase subunit Sec63